MSRLCFFALPLCLWGIACSTAKNTPSPTAPAPASRETPLVPPPQIIDNFEFTGSPVFRETQLSPGTRLLTHRLRFERISTIVVLMDAPKDLEPSTKLGLRNVLLRMMLERARGAGRGDIAKAFATLGTRPVARLFDDGFGFALEVLTEDLEPGLALLADLIKHPALDTNTFHLAKKEALDDRATAEASLVEKQDERISTLVYGEAHPGAWPLRGTRKSINAISSAEVADFFQKHIARAGLVIAVASALPEDTIVPLVTRTFGQPPRHFRTPSPDLPTIPIPGERKKILIFPREGARIIRLTLAGPGLPANHPDFRCLAIRIDESARQLFSSVHKTTLRFGRMIPLQKHPSPWGIQITVEAHHLEQSIDAILKSLFTAPQLFPTAATSHLAWQVLETSYASTAIQQTVLATRLALAHLPQNFFQASRRMTYEAGNNLPCKVIIDPDTVQLSLEGDPAVIREQLKHSQTLAGVPHEIVE